MTFLHLAYLQQVSDLLEDQHKPLAARLGFIASKISSKHLVHVNGADPPKLRRCKACQAPITCDNVRPEARKILVKCSLCGFQRRYSIASDHPKQQQKRQPDERAGATATATATAAAAAETPAALTT